MPSFNSPDVSSASGSHRSSSSEPVGRVRMSAFCLIAFRLNWSSCSRLNASRSSPTGSSSRVWSSSIAAWSSSASPFSRRGNVSPGASGPARDRRGPGLDEGSRRHARWLPRHRTAPDDARETHRREGIGTPRVEFTAGILRIGSGRLRGQGRARVTTERIVPFPKGSREKNDRGADDRGARGVKSGPTFPARRTRSSYPNADATDASRSNPTRPGASRLQCVQDAKPTSSKSCFAERARPIKNPDAKEDRDWSRFANVANCSPTRQKQARAEANFGGREGLGCCALFLRLGHSTPR